MHTVVSKARMGLVTVRIAGEEYALVDIGMRMLQPRELARARCRSGATGSRQRSEAGDASRRSPIRHPRIPGAVLQTGFKLGDWHGRAH